MTDEVYDGEASLVLDGHEVVVRVRIAAVFEPVDGRMHWAGRIAPDASVVTAVRGGVSTAQLTVDGLCRTVQLREVDPWGGVRLRAVS